MKLTSQKDTIWCRIRKKDVVLKPEEVVRQSFVEKLIVEYGYPEEHIDLEVPIVMGRDNKGKDITKFADIVIYPDKISKQKREKHYIIIECKDDKASEQFPEGFDQLKSYCNSTGAAIAVWTNGNDTKFFKASTAKPKDYEQKPNLPKYGQKYGDKKILKEQLRPATNLNSVFNKIHNDLRATTKSANKSKIFNQIMYLLFAKIEDEEEQDPECKFVIYDREYKEILDHGDSDSFKKRILGLFDRLKQRAEYKDVFDGTEKIEIPPILLSNFVAGIEYVTLSGTDNKGEAYQNVISGYFRKEMGQYFTPDPVKSLVVKMIDPSFTETILDPACGTSGFLVFALKLLRDKIKIQKKWVDENKSPLSDSKLDSDKKEIIKEKIKNIASNNIRGMDIENELTQVGKIWMVMVDDGHSGIHTVNSLLPLKELEAKTNGDIHKECTDIILTNPPFGSDGKEYRAEILSNFDLGHKWSLDKNSGEFIMEELLSGKGKSSGQVPDILFIERCYELLKEGGRMAIVLPDGDLNNIGTQFVRAWLSKRMQLVSVVSLPRETFLPYGANEKTSVLLLKKPKKNSLPENYPIFWYNIEKIGYDGQGRIEYKKNELGEILDRNGSIIPYIISTKGANIGKKTKQNPKLIEKDGAIDSEVEDTLREWEKFRATHKSYVW